MVKRLFFLTISLIVTIAATAHSFAGKTYRYAQTEDGVTATMTIHFTSASRLTMKFTKTGIKPSSLSFNYEVSGDVINIYDNTGIDYLYIDTRKEYGDDCIYSLDPYGNLYMVFEPVKSKPKSSGKTSTSKKR